jgi:hypothetical protein
MRWLIAAIALSQDPDEITCKGALACCRDGVDLLRDLEINHGTEVNYATMIESFERACGSGHSTSCSWARKLTHAWCPPGTEPFCAALALRQDRGDSDGGRVGSEEVRRAMAAAKQKHASAADWSAYKLKTRAEITRARCER